MRISQLTVFGAGLIGGSVCLAARRAGFAERVVALDVSPRPERDDVADMWANPLDDSTLEQVLRSSTLTVLCTPVHTIIDWLPRVLSLSPGVVTDCGSTKVLAKRAVQAHPNRERFVAGHPMAGHPEGGLGHASADLFDGKRWLLCPEGSSEQACETVRALIAAVGASVVELDASTHDHSVAFTSHLPQVVASALSVLSHDHHASAAAGPGFASATRVAGGAPNMWRDIFETNAGEIAGALSALSRHLDGLAHALEQGDAKPALDTLERARALRGKH